MERKNLLESRTKAIKALRQDVRGVVTIGGHYASTRKNMKYFDGLNVFETEAKVRVQRILGEGTRGLVFSLGFQRGASDVTIT